MPVYLTIQMGARLRRRIRNIWSIFWKLALLIFAFFSFFVWQEAKQILKNREFNVKRAYFQTNGFQFAECEYGLKGLFEQWVCGVSFGKEYVIPGDRDQYGLVGRDRLDRLG